MFVLERLLYLRTCGNAFLEALQRGPAADVELEEVMPVHDREEVCIGDRERVSRQVRFRAERIHHMVEARADRVEHDRLVRIGRRRLPQRTQALVNFGGRSEEHTSELQSPV